MMEKTASNTITRKMHSTTERVVSWPTLAALPRDLQAFVAADQGDQQAKTGALIMPTRKVLQVTAWLSWRRNAGA